MSSFPKFLTCMAVLCLVINSCSLKNKIGIKEKNFTDEIETRQNLVFKFDRDLAPDSVINIWDSTAYFKFTPEVKGSFKWNSNSELLFSPSGEFQPSTAYTGELTSNILKFSKQGMELDENRIVKFRTPYLKVESAMAWWSLSQDEPGMVNLNINLGFNYHIDPAVISRLLEIKLNGKPATFQLTDNGVTKDMKIKTASQTRELVTGCKLEYKIREGALCQSCQSGTIIAISGQQDVKAPDKLEVTHVEASLESGGGSMMVYCNQEVIMKDIAKLITIEPKMEITVEAEGNGFIVKGKFEAGASYELNISKQLAGALGGSMEQDYKAMVPFGEMEASISFGSTKGIYMSTRSSKKIAVNIVNIPKIRVRIFKIYENNIQAFMKYQRYNDYEEDYDGESYGYNDYNLDNLGDEIMNQDYETKNLPKNGSVSLLSLDFTDKNNFRGIYLVSVASTEDRWRKASKLVSISDIGIIARQTDDEVLVFTNSIKEAMPIRGAKVNFISTNNQVIQAATTDGDGAASVKSLKSKFPGFHIGMITVRNGNDFNYMLFSDTQVEDSRFDVGGMRNNPSGYEAFIYGDREIYRPGETVYLNTVIRSKDLSNLMDVPVKIKIIMPNGREFTTIRKNVNTQGAAEGSFQLSASSVTGTWSMEVYSSNDVLLNSRNFSVEEFIPDRISVAFTIDETNYQSGDTVKCETTAMNLFGSPAADRNYEMEFSLRKKYLYSKKFDDYNFTISGADNINFSTVLKQGKTDASGKAKENFVLESSYLNTGLLNGRIYVTVFDETGRPVNRVKNFDVSTQPIYYGLKPGDYYNSTKQPMSISMAAVDALGNPKGSGRAQLQVVKVYWETVMERTYGDHYRYVSQKQEKILVNKEVSIAKDGSTFSFTPSESGEYYVRLKDPNAGTWVQSDFYAYGWGYTQNNSFEVNNEGTIDMEFDKTSYEPGTTAKILCKTPFAGRILVTIERDKVFDYFYVNTDKRSASIEIPIKEEYLPNAYITTTLFRPLDDGMIPVTIAHGFAPIPVEKKSNKLPIEIIAVEKSRSNTTQKIRVKTISRSDIQVTVAVVDEGIMQLKNSPTPDPYGYFYQKRALEVNAFDIYPYVFPDLTLRRSSTGGDGYDLQKRVNPLTNKRVKLVAYWSGILKTDGNGEATCSVNIPQFSGDLRIMAVAYKDKSFGNAEKHMKVADPIVISPSMPRFLSPGDTLLLPVTITNTTAKDQKVTVSIEKTGPLNVIEEASKSISIAANSESRPQFRLAIARQIGEGTVLIKVNNGTENFTDKTDITIRPAASLQKVSGSGDIDAGKSIEVKMENNYLPGSKAAKLVVSSSPVVQFSDQLSYLLGYPYGCVEQTISTAFPQLYFSDLVKVINNKPGYVVQVSTNVQAAIRKLQSMQLYNGSLSYWPGGNDESWWGSAYALHFLTEAKKAGYDVNQDVIDKITAYLGMKVKQHPIELYYYYNDKGLEVKKEIPSKDIFYSLYLMSLYSKADIPTMNYYRTKINDLALDSKYLLAAAYLACGDRKAYQELLPSVFQGEQSKRSTGGNFYSYIRDEALSLNALLETDPTNPQIGQMVRQLSISMRKEYYMSTQERAFAFLSLGKFLKQASATKANAVISCDGKVVGEFKGQDITISKGINKGNISISTNGTGKLYYFWEMEGLSADGSFKQEDSYLQVRKTFFNRLGQPIKDLNNIHQNDLIVVKLSVVNTAKNLVENVVITDILPACLEIENPRISAVPELDWIKDNAYPQYMDIRDDRINLFTTVDYNQHNFYYLARAVSTGRFIMGPVSADAMYDGSYHSYNGAGVMTVKP